MKKNLPLLIPVLPYLIMTSLIFFILPTLEPNSRYFSFFMLLIIPVYCFVSAFIYGLKNGNVGFYPIFMGIIFLPPMFLIIEMKSLIYGGIYGTVALLGMCLGSLLKKRKDDDPDSEK
ncbi:hypothetical protein [Acetobacterium sp.]|jgi:hypothetical protein|uniref:hypothetical protein n=1 Tax=Acetobacterium sp. TaxID=1872094 RepID=UPI000CB80AC2|nr:hypothetical protein [Acetobacterium sp.]MDO9492111.1 hypothetical protein [Acetobacterium sp.]PKM74630.1 MAG: hypothetical protein CVU92_05475 [Firmicutes bacterium HGW-Firmicutes-17]